MSIRPAAAVGVVLCVLISLVFSTNAQTCNSYTFSGNRLFSSCNDLPVLNSFLHWNYIESNRTVNLAYRHTGVSSTSWVAWAINPNATGMVGSQALVAFQADGRMNAYTSPIAAYGTGLQPGNLSFPVTSITAEYSNGNFTIFATLVLPEGSNTTVNQVWQEGPLTGTSPGIHPRTGDNLLSRGTIDFLSPQTPTTGGGQTPPTGGGQTPPTGGGQPPSTGGAASSRMRHGNVHGVMNALSWGLLMPLAAIVASYL